MASLNIISQRENGFRVNSRAKGLTNAARQAIRIQSLQGGQPGSIDGVGKPCFESHSTILFQASWLSVEAFLSHS